MYHEDKSRRMEFKDRTLGKHTKWKVIQDPVAVEPVSHKTINSKRGGNRCALKVLALAARIFGEGRGGDIETSKAGETAKHEKGQPNRVDNGSEANREGHHGWCNSE